MKFAESVKYCLQNYVTLEGRAARSEYWYFVLFNALAQAAATILDKAVFHTPEDGQGPLCSLVALALFLPSVAVAVRRLHDGGRNGWWALLVLVPIIGWLVLLFWFVQKGNDGANEYGADPLQGVTRV